MRLEETTNMTNQNHYWTTEHYTVRRLGGIRYSPDYEYDLSIWATRIATFEQAQHEQDRANRITQGHVIVAHKRGRLGELATYIV